MARPLRIEDAEMWYHVMSRGNSRNSIFSNDEDYKKFLDQLNKSCKMFDVEVHSYVLMANHFHLFIKTNNANLSRFMHRLLTAYTVWFNRKHKRVGHLFQGRYKSIIVDNNAYGTEINRYIHLNPVRSHKFCKLSITQKRKLLQKYKWSSYPATIGLAVSPDFLFTNGILENFGDEIEEQRQNYSRFVEKGFSNKLENPSINIVGKSVLGDKNFIEKIQKKILNDGISDKDTKNNARIITSVNLEKIIEVVSSFYGINKEHIIDSAKQRGGNEPRQVTFYLASEFCLGKINTRDIGSLMGGVTGYSVSLAHKRMNLRLKKDKSLAKSLARLKAMLNVDA